MNLNTLKPLGFACLMAFGCGMCQPRLIIVKYCVDGFAYMRQRPNHSGNYPFKIKITGAVSHAQS